MNREDTPWFMKVPDWLAIPILVFGVVGLWMLVGWLLGFPGTTP